MTKNNWKILRLTRNTTAIITIFLVTAVFFIGCEGPPSNVINTDKSALQIPINPGRNYADSSDAYFWGRQESHGSDRIVPSDGIPREDSGFARATFFNYERFFKEARLRVGLSWDMLAYPSSQPNPAYSRNAISLHVQHDSFVWDSGKAGVLALASYSEAGLGGGVGVFVGQTIFETTPERSGFHITAFFSAQFIVSRAYERSSQVRTWRGLMGHDRRKIRSAA